MEDMNDESIWGMGVRFIFVTYKKYMTSEMV